MSYEKQTFLNRIVDENGIITQKGTVLKAEHLNHIEEGIIALNEEVNSVEEKVTQSTKDIADVQERVDELEEDIANNLVPGVGSFTATFKDGSYTSEPIECSGVYEDIWGARLPDITAGVVSILPLDMLSYIEVTVTASDITANSKGWTRKCGMYFNSRDIDHQGGVKADEKAFTDYSVTVTGTVPDGATRVILRPMGFSADVESIKFTYTVKAIAKSDIDSETLVYTTSINAANGVAGLDENAKLVEDVLPEKLVDAANSQWQATCETTVATQIIPEQTYTLVNKGLTFTWDDGVTLTVGEKYTVIWNSVEYICTCYNDSEGNPALGDQALFMNMATSSDSYPFYISRQEYTKLLIYREKYGTEETITFSIFEGVNGTVYNALPEEYLPESLVERITNLEARLAELESAATTTTVTE